MPVKSKIIGLIINYNAGHLPKLNGNGSPKLDKLEDEAKHSYRTTNLIELKSAIKEFHKKGVNIIAIFGGDGTNHKVITETIKQYGLYNLPKFAFLNGGSLNVARSCISNAPSNPLKRLQLLKKNDAYFHRKYILQINNLQYGFYFGLGGVIGLLEKYNKELNGNQFKGKRTAALKLIAKGILARALNKTNYFVNLKTKIPIDTLRINKKEIKGINWSYHIAAATLTDVLFTKPFYLADKGPQFHFVCSTATENDASLIDLIRGKPTKCSSNFKVSEVYIKIKKSLHYSLDGDIYYKPLKEFNIRIGPQIEVFV